MPITVADTLTTASALDYTGYGDPDGIDGEVSPPDAAVNTSVEGSGALRLLVASAPEGAYRVRVAALPTSDDVYPPSAPSSVTPLAVTHERATVTFVEPSDETAQDDPVRRYEVRILAGAPLTEENFTTGSVVQVLLPPGAPGFVKAFELEGLLPETHYWVGIRALDECLNKGPVAIIEVVTGRAPGRRTVGYCFIATAAWGSDRGADVSLLRSFRDRALRRLVVGEM